MKTGCVKKGLVVGIIVLFQGIVIEPITSIDITQEKEIEESNPEVRDSKWLATLRMDFGEEIYNEEIKYLKKWFYPRGDWYVNLIINFDCPSDRKIEIDYMVSAYLYAVARQEYWLTFIDYLEGNYTIINGSNPPDINKKYEKNVDWLLAPNGFSMTFFIVGELTVYEYVDDGWVKVDYDHAWIRKQHSGFFSDSRDSKRVYPFMRFIERYLNTFPILRHLLRL